MLVLLPWQAHARTFLILPLFNLTQTANLDWIGESVAETVRSAASSSSLVVLDREDRDEAYRRLGLRPGARLTLASIMKLGQTLGADQIFYGSYELTPPAPELTVAGQPADTKNKSRGTLKLSARLLDLAELHEGSEFSEVGPLEDLANMQRQLSWRTLHRLDPALAGDEDEFRKEHPRIRVDAIESYIRGLLARTAPERERLFAQAVQLDPAYSQASFELGRLYWNRQQYRQAAQWLDKVPPGDMHANEARFFLGLSRYQMGDFTGATRALDQTVASIPLNEAFNDLGAAQSRAGQPAKAEASFGRALQGDPADPVYQFNLGYVLWKKGDCAAAAPHLEAVLKRDPSDKDAALLLDRCRAGAAIAGGGTQDLERIKTNYEESAYRQLQDVFQSKRK